MSWKKFLSSSSRYLFLAMVALAFTFPTYFMVNTSLQSMRGIDEGYLYPRDLSLRNLGIYLYLFINHYWASAIRNSLIISASCIIVSILICFPAAYAFSRSRFVADKHLFLLLLIYRMAHPICFILPILIIIRGMGLWDTFPGVILAYCVFNIPLGTWIMTSFMNGIPKEIDETAFTDGYGLLGFFRKIFIPINKSGIAVTAFFVWMFSWLEWFLASILTSVYAKTLAVQMLAGYGGFTGLHALEFAAAGVITMIPGLILIVWARPYIAKGFTFGKA